MSKTQAVSGIVERAMLVDLTVAKFHPMKKDKGVTEKVAADYATQGDVGAYRKRLFPQNPKEAIAVQSIVTDIYAAHRRMTLPWANGWRILPRDMHGDYATEMQTLRHKLDAAVRAMSDALPSLIIEARAQLGAMFDANDYPTPAAFIQAHVVDIKFMPVPDVGDWRVKLDAETMNDIRASYEQDMRQYLEGATRDAWERLHAVVTNLSQAIERFDAKQAAEQRTTIKTAVLDNIGALTAILPKLNVTDDPNLAQIASEVSRQFGSLKIADIKDDLLTRQGVKKDADAILRKMSAFMGGDDHTNNGGANE